MSQPIPVASVAAASFSTAAPSAVPAAASSSSSSSSPSVTAYIAIGGNIGHRARNISSALAILQRTAGIRLEATSFLYETSPVGSPEQHLSQPRFLNAMLEISTSLSPLALLDALQSIEQQCGRTRVDGVRNGPRTVDLDLIFYESVSYQLKHARLILPHPRWNQRGFVLAPLRDLFHPSSGKDSTSSHRSATSTAVDFAWTSWLLSQASASEQEKIYRVIPFPTSHCDPDSDSPALSDVWRYGQAVGVETKVKQGLFAMNANSPFPKVIHSPTHIMGILNLTPDSFSDGGKFTESVERSVEAARRMWEEGADIIDIGGESTRPGSTPITPEEECRRILPVIRALQERYPKLKLSVDTYHPSVARTAVAAGCVMINDVCGGTIIESTVDEKKKESMLQVAAELNVPYVCMHIRGTPQTMTQEKNVTYSDIIHEVRQEQERQFNAALTTRASLQHAESSSSSILYRWNLIGDPGIGFAKSGAHAVALLRHLPQIRPFGIFPLLVGTSRKGFISRILAAGQAKVESRQSSSSTTSQSVSLVDRAWGTSATVTASIEGGAEIVRVHDVHEMRCVRDVADQIYRG